MQLGEELPLNPSAVVCVVDCRIDPERLRAFFEPPHPGDWPRVLVLIYSDPALSEAYKPFEEQLGSGRLKLWPAEQWQDLFEQETQPLRSAVATCKLVLGAAEDPIVLQLKAALKERAASFVQEIMAAGQELIAYYQSGAFRERLVAIAQGAKPRILVDQACSSVAVKRYSRNVAGTFQRLGYACSLHQDCQADERDVMGAGIIEARQFKPDLIVASPNHVDRHEFMPTQIQVPVALSLQDSDPHMVFPLKVRHRPLGRLDQVSIMKERFTEQILAAGVRPEQLHFDLLPVEAVGDALEQQELADVGFIKTMSPQRGLRAIIEETEQRQLEEDEAAHAEAADQAICRHLEQGRLADMQTVRQLAGPYGWDTELVHYGHVAFCESMIRCVHQAGHSLHLSGANWERIPDLAPYAQGHVESRRAYQEQFLKSRINLSLNPWVEYHPRILDGGACGAFFLVYRVPQDACWDRLPPELEAGVHFDCFETAEELKEKLAYYLARPELRQQMGSALRRYVEDNHSYESHCERLVDNLRVLIRKELS